MAAVARMSGKDGGADSKGKPADAVRQERLAQALRDNLKRRKTQIRGRGAETKPGSAPDRNED